jgi:predicted flap endonuclease-1-like 5' DNA nuclease
VLLDIDAVVKRGRRSSKGRGFSRKELKEVGLSLKQALVLRIPIDPKRSTQHRENVETLQTHLTMNVATTDVAFDLSEVKGIGQKKSAQLKAAGFDSLTKLAESEPQQIMDAVGVSAKTAARWIEDAKQLLFETA